MASAMVTGRIDDAKKERGGAVLKRAGLTASQAINLMYDRLIDCGDASFLLPDAQAPRQEERFRAAALFVDSLSREAPSRFDSMTKAEIKAERLAARGLL